VIDDQDLAYLRQAAALSRQGMEQGAGGPFGAVIVLDGQVVGRGVNRVTSSNDPTAHAEVVAIREACRDLGRFDLTGGVIYASCEPCPMCLAAIHWARLSRCVYANSRFQAAAIGFDDALLYRELDLPPGERRLKTLHHPLDEAESVFRDWLSHPDRIPY